MAKEEPNGLRQPRSEGGLLQKEGGWLTGQHNQPHSGWKSAFCKLRRDFKASLKTIHQLFLEIARLWRSACFALSMMKSELQNPGNFAKTLSLWLAEDDDAVRELLSEFFNRSALKCIRQFSKAEEVIRALKETEVQPDIILLDINMGMLDGIEAIGPIKRLASDVRVFIMTTFYDNIALDRARQAGASGFFLKRDDWDDAIARMLDRRSDWGTEFAPADSARNEGWLRKAGLLLAQGSAA